MNQKSILITGCSSGIGLCTAKELSARGYRVFATARKQQDVTKLNAMGLESLLLDLDDQNSITAAVNEVLSRTNGELYALFNNGAYAQPGALEDVTTEALKQQFQTNVFGWHELTRQLIPVMIRQGGGRIIQNSSVLGLIALRFRGPYVASKFAIEGLSDTLRQELVGTNVFISMVEPGPIDTLFRANSYKAYKKNIDKDKSRFEKEYTETENRLETEGPAVPFTLPPEAVFKKVLHALEAKNPRAHYYVTVPTYLFGFLKKILPARWLDKLLIRV